MLIEHALAICFHCFPWIFLLYFVWYASSWKNISVIFFSVWSFHFLFYSTMWFDILWCFHLIYCVHQILSCTFSLTVGPSCSLFVFIFLSTSFFLFPAPLSDCMVSWYQVQKHYSDNLIYFLFLSLSQGDVLFQMAEVHRQIQMQLEDMVSIINLMKIILPHRLTFSHYIFSQHDWINQAVSKRLH